MHLIIRFCEKISELCLVDLCVHIINNTLLLLVHCLVHDDQRYFKMKILSKL